MFSFLVLFRRKYMVHDHNTFNHLHKNVQKYLTFFDDGERGAAILFDLFIITNCNGDANHQP